MKKMILLFIAALLTVCFMSVGSAAGYVKDFSVEFDDPLCIVETDYITMEVNGIEVEDDYLIIDNLITNSNAKRGYEVSVIRASVNGIEVFPAHYVDVDAEDECDEPIEMSLVDVIENTDIKDIYEIELSISIEDDDMEGVYRDVVHIYPHGEEKAQRYTRKAAGTDIVIVDNGDYKITVTEFEFVAGWGYSIHMYIENKTEKDIYITGEDYELNDTDADTRYDTKVGAKGVNFSRLEWSQADLDDAEVEEVESIGFTISIYDAEEELMYRNTITLNP